MRKIVTLVCFVTLASCQQPLRSAEAQGIYMLNGRATPSVIVGNGGAVFPVIPNWNPYCHGGPCPVIIAPPIGFAYVRPPGYSPPPPAYLYPPSAPNHGPREYPIK